MTGAEDASGGRRRRLLVLGDSDSYVKWGAALASRLPPHWDASLSVMATPVAPSERQLAVALAGTRFDADSVRPLDLHAVRERVAEYRPDAVLLALRGPFVRVVAHELCSLEDRPVLVSGFPGLTIPAVPKAVIYRELCDLVVLHSRREVREFRGLGAELAPRLDLGLAMLPFLPAVLPVAADTLAGETALAGAHRARAGVAGWDGGGYRHAMPVAAEPGDRKSTRLDRGR
ncbi:DUF6716 putative glycosyltransferase, partial [Agromyces seonyuensis]